MAKKLLIVGCITVNPFTKKETFFYEVVENDGFLFTLLKRFPTKEEAIRYVKECGEDKYYNTIDRVE